MTFKGSAYTLTEYISEMFPIFHRKNVLQKHLYDLGSLQEDYKMNLRTQKSQIRTMVSQVSSFSNQKLKNLSIF